MNSHCLTAKPISCQLFCRCSSACMEIHPWNCIHALLFESIVHTYMYANVLSALFSFEEEKRKKEKKKIKEFKYSLGCVYYSFVMLLFFFILYDDILCWCVHIFIHEIKSLTLSSFSSMLQSVPTERTIRMIIVFIAVCYFLLSPVLLTRYFTYTICWRGIHKC